MSIDCLIQRGVAPGTEIKVADAFAVNMDSLCEDAAGDVAAASCNYAGPRRHAADSAIHADMSLNRLLPQLGPMQLPLEDDHAGCLFLGTHSK